MPLEPRAKRVLRKMLTQRGRAQLALAVARRLDPSVLPVSGPPAGGRSAGQPARRPSPPPTKSVPGSRVVSRMFFDEHPRFYESSETSSTQGRLNLRYEAIFVENRDIFEGARVLDISSHDGRWSYAALSVGAKHVVGIEARPELVREAEENMREYGVSQDRYQFITGDVFDVMAKEDFEFDVVMCLGFLYHTLRYNELFYRISQCRPEFVVVDTEVYPDASGPLIHMRTEPIGRQGNAVADQFSIGDRVMSGRPTALALRRMMKVYQFPVVRESDWGGLLRDNPTAGNVQDYRVRRRITVVGRNAER